MTHHESRYEAVTRRAFLTRIASVSAFVLVPGLAACSTSDAEVFSGADGDGAATTLTPTTVGAVTTAPNETTSTTEPVTTTAAETVGNAFPSGAELIVAFAYTPDASVGRTLNPYVAVWVEDAEGELVDTMALWFLQSQKGTRWLNELRRWTSVDNSQSTVDTISSATRSPGSYAVVWDGTDTNGQPVAAGDYFVCIESAHEHGPYSLIRQPVVLEGATLAIDLPADGELTNASVTIVV